MDSEIGSRHQLCGSSPTPTFFLSAGPRSLPSRTPWATTRMEQHDCLSFPRWRTNRSTRSRWIASQVTPDKVGPQVDDCDRQPRASSVATHVRTRDGVGKGRESPAARADDSRRGGRDRVISLDEEKAYLEAAQSIGTETLDAYERALAGIRATIRGEEPIKPDDPYRLRDVATLLIDCALRPEECFRLRWEHVRDAAVHIPFGKTASPPRNSSHAASYGPG